MTTLTTELSRTSYDKLFLSDDKELNRLWALPDTPKNLHALIASTAASAEVRFLAAEILARRESDGFPPPEAGDALAAAYAHALAATVEANRWGMPGELDEPAGQHLVALGRPAVPALRPLLSDTRAVTYGGSKEAMVGNDYHYRVKDFAAFFIARILKLPYRVVTDPAKRDQAISDLAAQIPR